MELTIQLIKQVLINSKKKKKAKTKQPWKLSSYKHISASLDFTSTHYLQWFSQMECYLQISAKPHQNKQAPIIRVSI